MKTVASMNDLQRLAASTGASAQVGGRFVNASADLLDISRRPPPAAPPAPAVAPPPPEVKAGMSAEEVRALLDARDAAWERRVDSLFSALMLTGERKQPPSWDFIVEYGSKREIVGIKAVPTAQVN